MANFAFVEYNGPDQNGKPHRRVVRSHAARNPVARRDRVTQYQQERQKREAAEKERQENLEREANKDAVTIDRGAWSPPFAPKMGTVVGFLQRHPSPFDVLGAARSDPFDCFARKLGPMDIYLLDHCQCTPFKPLCPI
jgi:hypothetical protein